MSAMNALLDAVTVMHDHPDQTAQFPAAPSSNVLPPMQKLSPIFPSSSIHQQQVQLPSISEMFKGYSSPPGTPSLQSSFVLQSSRRASIVSLSYQQSQVHHHQGQSTSPVMGYSATAASLAPPAHSAYQFPTPMAFAKQPSTHSSDISRPVSPLSRMNMTDTYISHQHHHQQPQRQHPYSHIHQFQQQISPAAPIAEPDCETNSNSSEPQQQLRQAKYVCTMPNCVKTFKRKHHLESHLVTHSPEKPFKCLEPGCGAAYRRAQELRRHKRIVTH
ncbi:hypothetical protein HDU81_001875 [Chytriomyces hyalinus]|nr:hypothetical protein HDU81_001875 [Chytriomyces hyalinus]